MYQNNKIILILSLIILVIFLIGIVQIFILRFESGDVYPPYSSLRSDPLGTMALYEGLENLSEITVERNYKSILDLAPGREDVIFCLGTEWDDVDNVTEKEAAAINTFIIQGGRFVIAYHPVFKAPPGIYNADVKKKPDKKPDKDEKTEPEKKSSQDKEKDKKQPGMNFIETISLRKPWGFDIAFKSLSKNADETYEPVIASVSSEGIGLRKNISWHTGLYFENLHEDWNVIYAWEGNPVLIERTFGKGTIVVSADSYFLSNEAMLKERYPDMLTWLIGAHSKIIFDEVHLGIVEKLGVMGLAREYRLHGFFFGILLIAGLFVWKNSLGLIPPYPEESVKSESILGNHKDSLTGLVNLLRRMIPGKDILNHCYKEWKKSSGYGYKNRENKLERIQELVDSENKKSFTQRTPVKTYQKISRILAERK